MVYSLQTLPVEVVYRIFDKLNQKTLFLSCRGICKKLNDILDTYQPYQVKTFTESSLDKFIISVTCCLI